MNGRDRIVALLGSLDDLTPQPETAAGNLQRRNQVPRAFAPAMKLPCPTCGENPTPGRLRSLRPCTTCGGTDASAGRGWIWVDPYDSEGREIGGEGGATAPGKIEVRCDSCAGKGVHPNGRRCAYCRSGMVKRPRDTVDLASGDAVEVAEPPPPASDAEEVLLSGLANRDRFSYGAVEHALDELRADQPGWWRLVIRVHVEGTGEDGLAERQLADLSLAIRWLEEHVPKPILVPSWLEKGARFRDRKTYMHRVSSEVAGNLRLERDEAIFDLRQEHSVEEIVRIVGLRKSQVYEILSRESARRAGVAA